MSDHHKRNNIETITPDTHFIENLIINQEKDIENENSDDAEETSIPEDPLAINKRHYNEEKEVDSEDTNKRKKRKDIVDKETVSIISSVAHNGSGRVQSGTKQPASIAGTSSQGKNESANKSGSSGKATTYKGKSGGAKGHQSKQEMKNAALQNAKNNTERAGDDQRSENVAPKVPPLKIVIPGGSGASARNTSNEQDREGGSTQRGSGKGRGNQSSLPYVLPSTGTGQTSSSSDETVKIKREPEDYDYEDLAVPSTSSGKTDYDMQLRRRKIKPSKDNQSRDTSAPEPTTAAPTITHPNPYQMYIHVRNEIDKRHQSIMPVKLKPPKDFDTYMMNNANYTLQKNSTEPVIVPPADLPPQMVTEYISQEQERHRLRIQHQVESEKLVLAVEQEILRVHGRAERAAANQPLPFSVCTFLLDKDVYNAQALEQEKRNDQRSRCNGRQINSWLQEVDDKWEKIKDGLMRRQIIEAQTLYAVQKMGWEWKLKELGICDHALIPKMLEKHVSLIEVTDFDLPA